ncbi:hypothetical protein IW140_000941 [Coemansia sp. RSA 1813]|nr:hypothetical protein IW140_000941 [Coemansia sp. RSA 1813]
MLEGTSKLVQDMLGDSSDSDTDLDLPDPITFLQPISNSTKSPATLEKAAEESRPKPMTTTYSPKRTPRSRRLSHHYPPQSPRKKSMGTAGSEKTPEWQTKKQFTAIAENQIPLEEETQSNAATVSRWMSPRVSKRKQPIIVREQIVAKERKKKKSEFEIQLVIQTTGLTATQLKRTQNAASAMSSQIFDNVKYAVTVHSDTSLLNTAQRASKGRPNASKTLCTHLVAPADKCGRATRTFKYMVGLVCGAHAVTPEWLTECVKARRLLPESEFSICGDTAMPDRTLDERPLEVGQLLKGYRMHLWGGDAKWGHPSSAHTLEEFKALATVAGAEIIDELEEEEGSPDKGAHSGTDEMPSSEDENDDANGGHVMSPRLRRRSAAVGRADRDSATDLVGILPKKYRKMFELPVNKGSMVVLVDLADLHAANRSSLRSIARFTGGTN